MSKDLLKGYSSAEARLARLGSYYAMFPTEFALDVIDTYSEPGDRILTLLQVEVQVFMLEQF